MSAHTKLIKDGNDKVYPVTIPAAIIDPQTGEPVNFSTQAQGGSAVAYTINNKSADNNGNFTISASDLGAASANHNHAIADIASLQTALDGKAAANHTHTMVTSLVVNGSTVTDVVEFRGSGNVQVSQSGNEISISITPYTLDTGSTITDGNSGETIPLGVFTGTEAEWEAFQASMPNNTRYLVFIRS